MRAPVWGLSRPRWICVTPLRGSDRIAPAPLRRVVISVQRHFQAFWRVRTNELEDVVTLASGHRD